MPAETMTAPAPAAPAAPPPTRTDAQVAAAAAKTTINVAAIPPGTEKAPPTKPGSMREQMNEALRKKAAASDPQPAETPTKPAVTKPGAKPPATTPETPAAVKEGQDTPPEATKPEGETTDPTKTTPDAKTKEKVNPWRLVDEWKGKATTLEKELAEARKSNLPPEKIKEFEDTKTKLEKRVEELESEMKFVDYSKSAEFREQYQQPYEKAWTSAMAELRELTVESPDGASRPISSNDLLALVNMPLNKARETAQEMFGESANDVMAHRREIRKLFDAQAQALEEARKNGMEREKQTKEKLEKSRAELTTFISEGWKAANEEATKHPKVGKYFTPVEGDDEINAALQRGFELVDKAFAENPADPSLSPEQRQEIIRRHAAIRNRAAAFGRLTTELARQHAMIEELKAKLAGYEATEPDTKGGEEAPESGDKPMSAMDRARAELRARAK